jgi:hypothetical protein
MKTKRVIQLAVLATSLLLAGACQKKSSDTWKANPPYPGMELKMSSFMLNAERDTSIVMPSGTTIAIPAGAIVMQDGTPTKGNYELLYREFHDAVDIFLAGIPMEYQSMGEKRIFQTAGMFDIDAQQNGVKLRMADGKQMQIRFASKYKDAYYSFFYLNPEKSDWEWVDFPRTEVNQQKVEAAQKLGEKLPKVFLGNNYCVLNYNRFLDIYLKNDYSEIYEKEHDLTIRRKLEDYGFKLYNAIAEGEIKFLKGYYHPAEMLWKDLDGKAIPKWTSNMKYDWVKDSKGKWVISNFEMHGLGNNQYQFTYKNGKESFTKVMEAVIPLSSILKFPPKQWQQKYDEAMVSLQSEQARVNLMAETFRVIEINQLGLYNFDCLLKNSRDWIIVKPTFAISSKPIDEYEAILILGDNSGYVRVKRKDIMKINPATGHRIFLVMPNQQMGIYSLSEQNKINADSLRLVANAAYTFNFEVKNIKQADDIRQILGFK